ncbi:hypothetical protein RhiirB3_439492, partial [Rhizophagus irregularis]
SSSFGYIGFDFRLGFGYMGKFPLQIFGWIFLWTSIEWVGFSFVLLSDKIKEAENEFWTSISKEYDSSDAFWTKFRW